MKKKACIILVGLLILLFTSCISEDLNSNDSKNLKPVKVMTIYEETIEKSLDYLGIVVLSESNNSEMGSPMKKVIKVGLTSKDISKISFESKVNVKVDEDYIIGKITNISQTPNHQTGTFDIEITIDNNPLEFGSIVKVEIINESETGVWIPITSIMIDDKDYVYVAHNDKVERRNITIGDIQGSKIKVDGLAEGDKLVIGNAKRINVDDIVKCID